MNTPTHPSPEQLNAYFDSELPPEDKSSLESHIQDCSGCQSEISWFSTLADLGKERVEVLPGESYWTDLPDRIMARALQNPVPTIDDGKRSWLDRFWNPQGGWRLAVGASVGLVLVAAVWIGLTRTPNPWLPGGNDNLADAVLAPVSTPAAAPATAGNDVFAQVDGELDSEPMSPGISPRDYSKRVIVTFGNRDNLGESLDIPSGQARPNAGGSSMGTTVSQSLPTLGPQSIADASGIIAAGCGEDPIQDAFMAALKAEESGDYALAAQGYQVVRSQLQPGESLRHEAEFRLVRLMWEERMTSDSEFTQRARAMAELDQLADRYFQNWKQSQLTKDCQKAWCMNKVLMHLAPELGNPNQLQLTTARVGQLKNCVE